MRTIRISGLLTYTLVLLMTPSLLLAEEWGSESGSTDIMSEGNPTSNQETVDTMNALMEEQENQQPPAVDPALPVQDEKAGCSDVDGAQRCVQYNDSEKEVITTIKSEPSNDGNVTSYKIKTVTDIFKWQDETWQLDHGSSESFTSTTEMDDLGMVVKLDTTSYRTLYDKDRQFTANVDRTTSSAYDERGDLVKEAVHYQSRGKDWAADDEFDRVAEWGPVDGVRRLTKLLITNAQGLFSTKFDYQYRPWAIEQTVNVDGNITIPVFGDEAQRRLKYLIEREDFLFFGGGRHDYEIYDWARGATLAGDPVNSDPSGDDPATGGGGGAA